MKSSRIVPLACFFLVLVSCETRRPSEVSSAVNLPADTISIGFYNVENLFDLTYDGPEYPEYRPGALGWNKQTFEIKLSNIASAVAALRVDVIALCEIENRSALEALRGELRKMGCAYPFAALADVDKYTATTPALLSRFPITGAQSLRARGDSAGGRRILETDILCDGTALKIFVNHWPSKAHPESRRMEMARRLVERIAQLKPGTAYVIAGDLNENYDEWRTFHTEQLDDTKGLTGLNHALKTVRNGPDGGISYLTKAEVCSADSVYHYDCWLDCTEPKRFSRTYHGAYETPDHFLLPAVLLKGGAISYDDSSFEAFTWNGRLLRGNDPLGWQMRGFGKRRFHAGTGYSDHLPLRIRLVKNRPTVRTLQAARQKSMPVHGKDQGFELSNEGWLGCTRGIAVSRDSSSPASGRYCLRMKGRATDKNCCAARSVCVRNVLNKSRWMKIEFDIRGSGKLSLRVRCGKGKWRYYNGEQFALSGSARYQETCFASWHHVVVTCMADNPSSRDIEIEFRAGKNGPSPFCFYIDNVAFN